MKSDDDLRVRSQGRCELCRGTNDLASFAVPPDSDGGADRCVWACAACRSQADGSSAMEPDHWRGLPETMWSEVAPVQVLAWRMLRRLRSEAWASDALDMLYLADDVREWAEAYDDGYDSREGSGLDDGPAEVVHRDSNGVALATGDSVTLIKDLNVKGAGFTAKRGTAVRGISLVPDNARHIEGRINGQQIVILTEFVKRSG